MYSAIAVEPTKLTAAIPGCCRIASTASLSPLTTLKTPGGNPASASSSAIRSPADGSRSDGFRMKVLPVAIAIGGARESNAPDLLAGRRVEHVAAAPARRLRPACDALAVDEMRDVAHALLPAGWNGSSHHHKTARSPRSGDFLEHRSRAWDKPGQRRSRTRVRS